MDIRFKKFVDSIEKLKNLQMHQEFIQNAEFERNPRDQEYDFVGTETAL